MSEVYYRKLFRVRFADSPSGYLSFVRLRAAEELMQYSVRPLKEISEAIHLLPERELPKE
ncbi:MAG: helix-turn-helix transcriptional regulator, partial [Bacilli bacterium]|nr:helix-turn-helix transcriptional regulator [Bacilli bacterium]